MNNKWQGRLMLSLLLIIIFVTAIRLALSPAIIYGANNWLESQGINSSIEDIHIDILDGTVSLINAEGLRDNKPLFHIGLVEIHWQWKPLSNKTIDITSITLDRFKLDIKHYSDSIVIGGLDISSGSSALDSKTASKDKNETEQVPLSWAANLGHVSFTNLDICYLQHTSSKLQSNSNSLFVDYCLTLDEMSWQGSIGYATDSKLLNTDDLPLSSTGNFILSDLVLTDNKLNKNLLVSKSSQLNDVTISGLNDIRIKQLQMEHLSLLQRDEKQHIDAVRFKQLLIENIHLSKLNSLKINSVTINNPGLYIVKQDKERWEYQQWLPTDHSNLADNKKSKQQAQKTSAATSGFAVYIAKINITDSDLCYLEKPVSLYYCLTFSSLGWDGNTSYNTLPLVSGQADLQFEGGLKLRSLKIKNHSLSRDFIDIDKLVLSGLVFNSTDDISLANVDIETFSALQRGEETQDTTAAFDKLSVDNIKYSKNRLSINTLKLSGIRNNVSKNKDGTWEHDKWLTENTAEARPAKQTAVHSPEKARTPLIIAIDKVEIDSNKNILFTDNSTTPAMNIGLESLKFHIDNLYSTKPDTDSPFELYAKTSRHSTVDINGTVKPFAEKLSFDATGKLKGFDLRAATPVVSKAIGHKIQSGQLDAELTLKAVAGQLDSNVSLSLYHFRIKPESKKDAEELDKKFGMPLNQTLVLLRNKDDSIHLDIPITGDVNKPNFNPMDAIITATSKAATVTLITFYTPYGLIYAGGNLAFNIATALNFDPITFTPGSSELLDENKEQLDGLAKLMTEKPQIHLTLCGMTSPLDAYKLFPEFQKQKDEHQKNKTDDEELKSTFKIILSDEQNSQLETLASQRQVNSKNYLITEHEIQHDRLILCAPEHNTDEESIAGVEINI